MTVNINDDELLTSIGVEFDTDKLLFDDFTIMEVNLGESLHTPGLQTSIKVHSYLHNTPVKNFDELKNVNVRITLDKPALSRYRFPTKFDTVQKVYRLDNRKLFNNNTEEFFIRACDETLLNDAETRVSKSWKCATPSTITDYVLRTCVGARNTDVEGAINARDYIAENIHPFQVINQQANFALSSEADPSFLHYMTYEKGGTHHFRSLSSLTKQNHIIEYTPGETGIDGGFGDPRLIMTYRFPCDFDLLSDVLNGLDREGNDINTVMLFNPLMKSFSMLGNQVYGCGMGSGVVKQAITNMNSAQQQDMCPDYTSAYLLKRQARMSLLETQKIALRLVVPFNPVLHAGKIIRVSLYNKESGQKNYGSGDYLIMNMVHSAKFGGYATTTMDCVSETVGRGIV